MYSCKSDTISPADDDDIAMSVTCFPEKQVNIAVMYGGTDDVIDYAEIFLGRFKSAKSQTAFHPMILPMVYVELERKRLLSLLEEKTFELEQNILDAEKRLWDQESVKRKPEVSDSSQMAKDCETTKVWMGVSSLKNGLESLREQILSMSEHCRVLSKDDSWNIIGKNLSHSIDQEANDKIIARLQEMSEELNTKVRQCETVLGGTLIAGQLVCHTNIE